MVHSGTTGGIIVTTNKTSLSFKVIITKHHISSDRFSKTQEIPIRIYWCRKVSLLLSKDQFSFISPVAPLFPPPVHRRPGCN